MSNFPFIAVIGGTGMGELFPKRDERAMEMYEGKVHFQIVREGDLELVFIDRHRAVGASRTGEFRLPHHLEHEVYMRALYHMGVRFILATSAVGGVRSRISKMEIGSFVAPEDFVDFTQGVYTFAQPNHTHPTAFHRPSNDFFCPYLRKLILDDDPRVIDRGVLGVAVKGPRFETLKEMKLYDSLGVDLVGMATAVPEAVLAREASMHYALVCVVTDMPLEISAVSGVEVARVMRERQEPLRQLIVAAARGIYGKNSAAWLCHCAKEKSVFELVPGL